MNLLLGCYFATENWLIFELHQKLKSFTVKNNCNPEWNEELTLAIENPNEPVNLVSTS